MKKIIFMSFGILLLMGSAAFTAGMKTSKTFLVEKIDAERSVRQIKADDRAGKPTLIEYTTARYAVSVEHKEAFRYTEVSPENASEILERRLVDGAEAEIVVAPRGSDLYKMSVAAEKIGKQTFTRYLPHGADRGASIQSSSSNQSFNQGVR